MMKGKRLVAAAALLAAAQIGFLGWMIQGRASILRNGSEVLLKVEPVDPRDLLRGDYVRLGYEISDVPAALISNWPGEGVAAVGGEIHLRLKRDGDGYWRAVGASLDRPLDSPPAEGEVDLRGVVAGWNRGEASSVRVDFGIERYYVPEGEGLAIERDMRIRPFGILAAVDEDGTPQIKALMDGETVLFEEPLY